MFFLLMAASCNKSKTIAGYLPPFAKHVYLEHLTLNSTKVIDSANIDATGKFSFYRSYLPGIYALRYGDDGEAYLPFCYNGKPIWLQIDTAKGIRIKDVVGDSVSADFNRYINGYTKLLTYDKQMQLNAPLSIDSTVIVERAIKNQLLYISNLYQNPYVLIHLFSVLDKQDDIGLLTSIHQRVKLPPYDTEMSIILNRNKAILDSFGISY
jgi:hypothetical protein